MMQTKEECLEFLAEARRALDDLTMMSDQEKQLEQEEQRLEKVLETERRAVADNIRMTVKKRSEEISASYDKEIGKGQDQLKKARNRREKAKTQGVKDRINEETEELTTHNRELRLQMKSLFQQHRIPGYCRSGLYYSLYFPHWFKEYLVLLLFVLVLFLAVPYGIYFVIPNHRPLYLAGIYLLDILVVGGLYVAIGNRGKLQYTEALKEGRKILDQIHGNNKKIHVIVSTIRKDRNESLYDLEKFDDEIAQVQQELSEVANKKKDALNTFETVTKTILSDEIIQDSKEKLDGLQADYDKTSGQLKNVAAQVKEKRLYITDHYGTYLGKDFLDPLKVSELSAMIQSGQAQTLNEAIKGYKEH